MRRVAVRAIVVRDNKLLLVKLKPYNGKEKNYYCTVGGGLDEGESLVDGLKREVLEETGVEAQVGKLLFVQQYIEDANDCLEFFFLVTNASDFESLDLTKTSHGTTEIAEIGFFAPQKVNLLPKFLKDIDLGKLHSQTDVQTFSYK